MGYPARLSAATFWPSFSKPFTCTARKHLSCAGSFGERVVAVDAAGNLTSSRGGMQPTRLVALGGDLFTPEAAPGQQFRFVFEGDTAAALEVDGGAAVPRG